MSNYNFINEYFFIDHVYNMFNKYLRCTELQLFYFWNTSENILWFTSDISLK